MSSVVTRQTECLNCGTMLSGPFCFTCGQQASAPNPTFHDVVHELTHEFLHVDGRLFRSVKLLFTRPGFLTREYCQGRKAPYLAPLRLYLIFSVLFFAVAAYAPDRTTVTIEQGRGRTLNIDGLRISGAALLPEHVSDAELVERVHRAEHDWLPKLNFVLVPIWAVFVWVVTRRERRHFPEHLYFALHVHAAYFGLRAVGVVIRWAGGATTAGIWTLIAFALVAWYFVTAFHRVYEGTWWRATRRAFAVQASYLVVLIMVLGTFFALAIRR
jgi:hypothetical protein